MDELEDNALNILKNDHSVSVCHAGLLARRCLSLVNVGPELLVQENIVRLGSGDFISEHALWVTGWIPQEPGTFKKAYR